MKKLVFLVLILVSQLAFGAPLSRHAYLRKLSLHIRGEDPTLAEHDELTNAIKSGDDKQFFDKKIHEYLASENHIEKMNYRLDEMFWLKSPSLPQDLASVLEVGEIEGDIEFPSFDNGYVNHNSMNAIFRDIVRGNRSWDLLLTGKSYKAYYYSADGVFSRLFDVAFYGAVANLPPTFVGVEKTIDDRSPEESGQARVETNYVQVDFDQNDPRIAGVVTTSRFFERYSNTGLNKNRRRAAAIFRTFLCEPLFPVVVPPDANKKKELLDLVRLHKNAEANESVTPPNERHGTDPTCMKCHSMLDPMGRTFQASGIVLSDKPAMGALYYKEPSGNVVNIPVNGLGGLANAIVKQDKYIDCQVKRFWQWFVGTDVNLTPERQHELVTEFNKRDRRVNDFIAYLVAQPEFLERRVANPVKAKSFLAVKPTFQKCAACHSQSGVKVPDFGVVPYELDEKKMVYWVDRIKVRLDLVHEGKDATMPPKISAWRPSPDEISAIKYWISLGAPDEQGKPTTASAGGQQ